MKTSKQYANEVFREVKKYMQPMRIWPSVYPDLRAYIEAQFRDSIEQAKLEQASPTPPATADQE